MVENTSNLPLKVPQNHTQALDPKHRLLAYGYMVLGLSCWGKSLPHNQMAWKTYHHALDLMRTGLAIAVGRDRWPPLWSP